MAWLWPGLGLAKPGCGRGGFSASRGLALSVQSQRGSACQAKPPTMAAKCFWGLAVAWLQPGLGLAKPAPGLAAAAAAFQPAAGWLSR